MDSKKSPIAPAAPVAVPPPPAELLAMVPPAAPAPVIESPLAPAPLAPVATAPAPASAPAPLQTMTFRERLQSFTMEDWRAAIRGHDPLVEQKLTPQVTARRKRLTHVVKGLLVACAGLCLVAVVRSATASESEGSATIAAEATTDVGTVKKTPRVAMHPKLAYEQAHEVLGRDPSSESGRGSFRGPVRAAKRR